MQDLGEQRSGDGDLCELECDVAAMTYDLGTDLDQLLASSANVGFWLAPGVTGTPARRGVYPR